MADNGLYSILKVGFYCNATKSISSACPKLEAQWNHLYFKCGFTMHMLDYAYLLTIIIIHITKCIVTYCSL